MTVIVHHLNNSRSQRVLWMLEELGLDYDIRLYQRDTKTMFAPPELRQVHPLGKSPAIEHEGWTLIETGAIVEYLVELGGGRLGPPANRDDVLRYRQFLHYAEGSLMPPLLMRLVLSKLPIVGKIAMDKMEPMIDVHLDWLESELATRDWFAGADFTAADIMMSFPLEAARVRAGLDDSYPHLVDWLDRVQSRPAYIAALERGGPYAYA